MKVFNSKTGQIEEQDITVETLNPSKKALPKKVAVADMTSPVKKPSKYTAKTTPTLTTKGETFKRLTTKDTSPTKMDKAVGSFIQDSVTHPIATTIDVANIVGRSAIKTLESVYLDAPQIIVNAFANNEKLSEFTKRDLTKEGLSVFAGGEDIDNMMITKESALNKNAWAKDVTTAVANMLPMVATAGVAGIPMATQLLFGTSAFGSSGERALQDGASARQAAAYASLDTALELVTEKIFGFIPGSKKGVGLLDETIDNVVKKVGDKTGSIIVQSLFGAGFRAFGEATEESLAAVIEPIIRKFTYDPNSKMATLEDVLYAAALGAVTSGVMEAPRNISEIKGYGKENVAINNIISSKNKTEIDGAVQSNSKKITELESSKTGKYEHDKAIDTQIDNLTYQNRKLNKALKVLTENDTVNPTDESINYDDYTIENIDESAILDNDSIYSAIATLTKQREELINNWTKPQNYRNIDMEVVFGKQRAIDEMIERLTSKLDTKSQEEAVNILEEQLEVSNKTMADKVEKNEATPVDAEAAKNLETMVAELAKKVDAKKTVKKSTNTMKVNKEKTKNLNDAQQHIDMLNAKLKDIGIQSTVSIANPTNVYERSAIELAAAFGKQLILFNGDVDLKGATVTNNPNVIFYNKNKNISSTAKTADGAVLKVPDIITFTVSHEIFHTMKYSDTQLFEEFNSFVKQTTTREQIVEYINERYGYDEVRSASALENIDDTIEEMCADEFGRIMTDPEYISKLHGRNATLLSKIIEFIGKIFNELSGSKFKSVLTNEQVESLKRIFEVNMNNTHVELFKNMPHRQLSHVTDSLDLILDTNYFVGDMLSVGVQTKGARIPGFGRQAIILKPEILKYSDGAKLFVRDGGVRRTVVRENPKQFNSMEDFVADEVPTGTAINYNEANFKGNIPLTLIQEVILGDDTPKDLLDRLSDMGIPTRVVPAAGLPKGTVAKNIDGSVRTKTETAKVEKPVEKKTVEKPVIKQEIKKTEVKKPLPKKSANPTMVDTIFSNFEKAFATKDAIAAFDGEVMNIDTIDTFKNFNVTKLEQVANKIFDKYDLTPKERQHIEELVAAEKELPQTDDTKPVDVDKILNVDKEIKTKVDADVRVRSKQELYDDAKSTYDTYVQSGSKPLLDKAYAAYSEYRDMGGSKIIETLENKIKEDTRAKNMANVKVSTVDTDNLYDDIQRRLDRYNITDNRDSKRIEDKYRKDYLVSLKASYANYKNKGGIKTIDMLEETKQSVKEPSVKIELDKNVNIEDTVLFKTIESYNSMEDNNAYKKTLYNKMVDEYVNYKSSGGLANIPQLNTDSSIKLDMGTSGFQKDAENNEFFANFIEHAKTTPSFKTYEKVSNAQAIADAEREIIAKGAAAFTELLTKERLTSADTPLGVFGAVYYRQINDYNNEMKMFSKLMTEGTSSSQYLQSLKILKNLSPAATLEFVKKQMNNMFEEAQKSSDPILKAWVKQNSGGLKLTEAEQQWVYEVANRMRQDGISDREYTQLDAMLKTFIAEKIPNSISSQLKSGRILSMLGNPATLIKNFTNNLVATVPHITSDTIAASIDKVLSMKSGIRAKGSFSFDSASVKRGASEALEDAKMGIRTDLGDAYSMRAGKPFNETGNFAPVGKVLNTASKAVYTTMDIGDRVFSETYYDSALKGLLKANPNATDAQIEIFKIKAQEDAHKKTWKNKGKAVKLVNTLVNAANVIHIGEMGLGDMVQPFTTVPTNLAVAAYEFSPASWASVVKNAFDYKKAMNSGGSYVDKFTAQKNLSDSVGRAAAGTLLYIIGTALARAAITSGSDDDEEKVKNMNSAMGNMPNSFKIGDTSFSYDWMQPINTALSITADISSTGAKNKSTIDAVSEAMQLGGDSIYNDTILSTMSNLLSINYNSSDSVSKQMFDNVLYELSDIPASFVPTLSKQIGDLSDNTQYITYDKNSIWNTLVNKIKVKVPGLRSGLSPKYNSLGEEMSKYHSDNFAVNALSTLIGVPIGTEKDGGLYKEISSVYKNTTDASVIPNLKVTSIKYDGENYSLSTKQQSSLQKEAGEIFKENMSAMLLTDEYGGMSDDEKATTMNTLLKYAKYTAIANSGIVPDYEIKDATTTKISKYIENGLDMPSAIVYDITVNDIVADKDENNMTISGSKIGKKAYAIMSMNASDEQKNIMLRLASGESSVGETTSTLSSLITEEDYIKYYGLSSARRVSYHYANTLGIDANLYTDMLDVLNKVDDELDSADKKKYMQQYINALPLSSAQKLYLYAQSGYSINKNKQQMYVYINSLSISAAEKKKIWSSIY